MDKSNWIIAALGMAALIGLVSWWDNGQQGDGNSDSSLYDRLHPDRKDWNLPTRDTSSKEKTPTQSSLKEMTDVLYLFSKPEQSLENLVNALAKRGLQPKVFPDSNPYTGNMYVIRTDQALKGTRYFHAQYFSGESEKPFVQHMSFQFRPGKKAMKEAVDMLHKSFPGLGKPSSQEDNFLTWDWKDGYVVWVRRLDKNDIKDGHEFNAYSEDDIGTIQVALEMEVDGHDHQAAGH